MRWLLRLFGTIQRRDSRRAAIAIEAEPRKSRHFLPYARTAIDRIGLIKPEYAQTIADLAEQYQFSSSSHADLATRKSGTQLDAKAKRALGVRSNTFYSTQALAMLTEAGKARPMEAIEITLRQTLRSAQANLSTPKRPSERKRATDIGCTHYIWRAVNDERTCKECRKKDGKFFSYNESANYPGECDNCTSPGCRCYAEPVLEFTPEMARLKRHLGKPR